MGKVMFMHGPLSGLYYESKDVPPPESIRVVGGKVEPPLNGYSDVQIAESMERVSEDWREDFEYRLDGAYRSNRGSPFRYFFGFYIPSFHYTGVKRGIPVGRNKCQKFLSSPPSMIDDFDRWWVWCLAKVKMKATMPAKS
jgi:hypothetical protein